jgi:hypothetical protein
MPSITSQNSERVSSRRVLLPIGRLSSPEPRSRFGQLGTHMSTRSDVYARPDVYDIEYEGASNHDARFFARLLARVRPRRVLELACRSGRVTFTLAAALPMAEIVGVERPRRRPRKGGHRRRPERGELALFDLLLKDDISKADRERVKLASVANARTL